MDQTSDAGRPGDHHGDSARAEGLTVGDAQHGNPHARTQDAPGMAQNSASAEQKLQGVYVQTEADIAGRPDLDVRKLLTDRIDQAGLSASAEEIDAMVARLCP